MSTLMFSALSAVAIAVALHVLPVATLSNPAIYLMAAGIIIFGFWWAWNYAILFAILSLGALAIQQWFERDQTERIPMIRPAAAVSLSVAQGVIYKIVIALLWIFIFVTLDFNERTAAACSQNTMHACSYLVEIQKNLVGIVLFNLIVVFCAGSDILLRRDLARAASHSRTPHAPARVFLDASHDRQSCRDRGSY